jgi:hypothetical protein
VPDGRVPDGCGFRRQSEDPLPAPLPHPQPHPQRHSARQPAASRDHEALTVCADCQGFMIMKIDSQFGRGRSGSGRTGPPAIPGPCPASHHKAALYPRRTTTPPHPPAPNLFSGTPRAYPVTSVWLPGRHAGPTGRVGPCRPLSFAAGGWREHRRAIAGHPRARPTHGNQPRPA